MAGKRNHSIYIGPQLGPKSQFVGFNIDITPEQIKSGYWRFDVEGKSEDDLRAYSKGFMTPEAVLDAAVRGEEGLSDIYLRWIPGQGDTYKVQRVGTPEEHLKCISEEREASGLSASFRDEVPTYPIDTTGKLFNYRMRSNNFTQKDGVVTSKYKSVADRINHPWSITAVGNATGSHRPATSPVNADTRRDPAPLKTAKERGPLKTKPPESQNVNTSAGEATDQAKMQSRSSRSQSTHVDDMVQQTVPKASPTTKVQFEHDPRSGHPISSDEPPTTSSPYMHSVSVPNKNSLPSAEKSGTNHNFYAQNSRASNHEADNGGLAQNMARPLRFELTTPRFPPTTAKSTSSPSSQRVAALKRLPQLRESQSHKTGALTSLKPKPTKEAQSSLGETLPAKDLASVAILGPKTAQTSARNSSTPLLPRPAPEAAASSQIAYKGQSGNCVPAVQRPTHQVLERSYEHTISTQNPENTSVNHEMWHTLPNSNLKVTHNTTKTSYPLKQPNDDNDLPILDHISAALYVPTSGRGAFRPPHDFQEIQKHSGIREEGVGVQQNDKPSLEQSAKIVISKSFPHAESKSGKAVAHRTSCISNAQNVTTDTSNLSQKHTNSSENMANNPGSLRHVTPVERLAINESHPIAVSQPPKDIKANDTCNLNLPHTASTSREKTTLKISGTALSESVQQPVTIATSSATTNQPNDYDSTEFTTRVVPLSENVPCMDCEGTDFHRYDCNIGNIGPLDLTATQISHLANIVEDEVIGSLQKQDDEFYLAPPEPESLADSIAGMAELLRKDKSVKKDSDLAGLSDHELLVAWGMKSIGGTVVYANGEIASSMFDHEWPSDNSHGDEDEEADIDESPEVMKERWQSFLKDNKIENEEDLSWLFD